MKNRSNIFVYCLPSIVIALTIGALFLVSKAVGAEPVPPVVTNAWTAIKDNQKFIEKNRKIVDEWNNRKTNNAVQSGIMSANCYDYDFKSAKPVKREDCPAKENLQ